MKYIPQPFAPHLLKPPLPALALVVAHSPAPEGLCKNKLRSCFAQILRAATARGTKRGTRSTVDQLEASVRDGVDAGKGVREIARELGLQAGSARKLAARSREPVVT